MHLLIIFCTDIEQVINLFYLFIFFSLRLYSGQVYLQQGAGEVEVQNPKEYLRYKYKYILNNTLSHALSMFKSTVDVCTCFLIDWHIKHTTLQTWKPSKWNIQLYLHVEHWYPKYSTLKTLIWPPQLLQRTSELTLTMVTTLSYNRIKILLTALTHTIHLGSTQNKFTNTVSRFTLRHYSKTCIKTTLPKNLCRFLFVCFTTMTIFPLPVKQISRKRKRWEKKRKVVKPKIPICW